ncbi:MAG: MaoC family dehydratase N-terminal domain-containing protein [Rhodospirillaceae bacterium]
MAGFDQLQHWIGRTEEAQDTVLARQLDAMAATLDRADPPAKDGDTLPAAWHWMYFAPSVRHSGLGRDGHPGTRESEGGFLPPIPLPRRMWAGNKVTVRAPIQVGEHIKRISTIDDITVKEGRSGTLVFLKIRNAITGDRGADLDDVLTAVYRDDPKKFEPPREPAKARKDGVWSRTITPDPVLLFRYSALTFNGHRIHYDRDYTTTVEGYPGLLVHGPLTATLLLDLARREQPDKSVSWFRIKATSPLYDTEPFTLSGAPSDDNGAALWAADANGNLAMEADIKFGG